MPTATDATASTSQESPRTILARQQLADAYAAYADAIVIHYSCGSLDTPAATRPIFNIVVKRLRDGTIFVFDAFTDSESIALAKFTEFANENQNSNWVNWNCRDQKWGFESIAERQQFLNVNPANIPIARRVDISRLLWNILGEGYIDNPKLAKVAEKNFVNVRDFNALPDNPSTLLPATLRKVEVIEAVFILAAEGRLITNFSLPATLSANDPFQTADWFEENVKELKAPAIRQAARRNRIRKNEIRRGLNGYSVNDVRKMWPEKRFLSEC